MEQSSMHSIDTSPLTLKLPATAPMISALCRIGRRQIVDCTDVKFSDMNGMNLVGAVYTPGLYAVLVEGSAPEGEPGAVSVSVVTTPTVLYFNSVPVAPPAAVLYKLYPVAPVTAPHVTVTVEVEPVVVIVCSLLMFVSPTALIAVTIYLYVPAVIVPPVVAVAKADCTGSARSSIATPIIPAAPTPGAIYSPPSSSMSTNTETK